MEDRHDAYGHAVRHADLRGIAFQVKRHRDQAFPVAPSAPSPPHSDYSQASPSARVHDLRKTGAARSAARETGCVVVLKGAATVIAAPNGEAWVNPTGNPGMASGGMGDVLTGVIVALLGGGVDALSAGVAGVYLHGLAGDLAAEQIGPRGILAGDLLERIPAALDKVWD